MIIFLLLVIVNSRPASVSKSDCCGCFQRKKRESLTLSDIYARPCSTPGKCALRAPLGPPENQCACATAPNTIQSLLRQSDYELGKEKAKHKQQKKKDTRRNANYTEFEFADDAISLNNETIDDHPNEVRATQETSFTENPYITVNGKEELPCVHEIKKYNNISAVVNGSISPKKTVANDETKLSNNEKLKCAVTNNINKNLKANFDGNYNKLCVSKIYSYCTLPKRSKNGTTSGGVTVKGARPAFIPPKRITPDGTHIYYWCDLHKKCNNGKYIWMME